MTVPANMLCSKSHEYVYEENGVYSVGLTDYAIEQLGDIVFVELPEVGSVYTKGEIFGTIESVKAASELYMPLTGKIVEIKEELIEHPELLNEEPFEKMWLIKVSSDSFDVDKQDLTEYETYKKEVE
mgnify:CR=1 FL=1